MLFAGEMDEFELAPRIRVVSRVAQYTVTLMIFTTGRLADMLHKKLSYRRETARQLHATIPGLVS